MIKNISTQSLPAILRTLAKQVEDNHPDTPAFSVCLASEGQSLACGRYETDPVKLMGLLHWQLNDICMQQFIDAPHE